MSSTFKGLVFLQSHRYAFGMKHKYLFLLLSVGVIFIPNIRASEHHAPLPDKVLSAKTVYIDNRTGFEEAADHCYDALKKWGRYTITGDKSKSDLVFLLEGNHETRGAYVPHDSGVVTTIRRSATSLSVIDPSNGDVLWSDTQYAPRGSKAGSLVAELRKRVEASEKQH
jgi:hypothetical protein